MIHKSQIIEVKTSNLVDHPGAICSVNPKNQYYDLKFSWLREKFKP